ncbi:type II toxin-antitoxin system HipA family toxin [Roseateles sp.]|uniref:type II toxin-antitoxin system HipA family toxin n=1 Tax=Roseateles sp. TaxID=1971397 RepID=UPI002F40A681
MSADAKPVWVWLPHSPVPVECGVFSLKDGVGIFEYRQNYLDAHGVALDLAHLALSSRARPIRETRQDGLFGVIRDAKPEGYGLDLLAHLRQVRVEDHMAVLEESEGDSVGAIAVCDDVARKQEFHCPPSHDLLQILADVPDSRPASDAVREVKGIVGTSAGGERPKLTVMHEGQQWLAKLQDRGDRPHSPLREFVAMKVATALGVNAAEVQFKRVEQREVILVRRFDREVDAQRQVTRRLFASAHTVLGLDKQVRGSRERSYLALAHELQRWRGRAASDTVLEGKRELFRRIVMNAVLGNGDDHPRNTGFLFDGTGWTLSPAFDIAPYGMVFSGTQSMDISRSRTHAASSAVFNLIDACTDYGYVEEEAREYIATARRQAPVLWTEQVIAAGFREDDLPFQTPIWLDVEGPAATTSRRSSRGR